MGRQDSKDKHKLSAVDSIERLPLSEQVYLTLKNSYLNRRIDATRKAFNEVKNCRTIASECYTCSRSIP